MFLNRAVDNLRLRYDTDKDDVELFLTADGYGLIRKDGKDTIIPPGNLLYMELAGPMAPEAPPKTGGCAGCKKKKAV